MRRRTYLAYAVSGGIAAASSGCTEEALKAAEERSPLFEGLPDEAEVDLPVEQEFDVVAAGVEHAAEARFEDPADFEDYLLEEGVAVEHLESTEVEGETILELEYEPERSIERGNAHDLGIVAGGFAALVRGGYDGERLDVVTLDADGRQFGAFEAEKVWAEAYVDGATTAAEYGRKVLRTLETKRAVAGRAPNDG